MRWILPKASGEEDSLDKFKLTDITTELIVVENSPWIGKTLEELITQKEKEFSLLSWIRGETVQDHSQKNALLEAGDNFVIRTTPDELVSFDGGQGLQLKALHKFGDGKDNFVTLAGEEKRILKAVIAHNSVFLGLSVSDMNFYDRFGAAIVGIWRKSGWISTGVANVILRAGDMLVIWGPMEKLNDLVNHRGFLMVLPFFASPKKRNKSKVAIGIMLISIALAATSTLPAHIAFLAGAVAMVLTKCVNIEQSYEAIEVKIFVMIAGVIPLGIAMEHTGVDKLLAGQLQNFTGSWQPFAVLMIFYWISALITQILSDSATTVLIAPIAVAFAKSAQLSPTAAVVCVTMGAVASFLTPIGHHGNLLILSPGGYKFADFLKIGLPLTLILSVITCYMSLVYM
jgi:di/tricarboxylate transporter